MTSPSDVSDFDPPRSSTRRSSDAVVKAVAEQALNDWLSRLTRKVVVWIAITGLVAVGGMSWVVSAWATNHERDVTQNTVRIDRVERQQEAMLVAMREQTQATQKLAWVMDSLRITLQRR